MVAVMGEWHCTQCDGCWCFSWVYATSHSSLCLSVSLVTFPNYPLLLDAKWVRERVCLHVCVRFHVGVIPYKFASGKCFGHFFSHFPSVRVHRLPTSPRSFSHWGWWERPGLGVEPKKFLFNSGIFLWWLINILKMLRCSFNLSTTETWIWSSPKQKTKSAASIWDLKTERNRMLEIS